MSRSKQAVELCALLVDETYGELTSRIFTILLRRGRLPIPLLSKHTGLTSRQLRHGLAVLIQQNLVFHCSDADSGSTHYEANHDAAYGLIRSGKIMEIVEGRYGAIARDVVQNLFLLGHTQISDLVEAYESKRNYLNGSGNGYAFANGTNGQNKVHTNTAGQLHAILFRLLEAGVIEPVVESMFRSPSDTYNKIEREILQATFSGSTKGNKQKDELKSKIRERLQEVRSESRKWQLKGKRLLNGENVNGNNGISKRRRLSNGGAVQDYQSYEDDGMRLDQNLVVRINFEKCTVALRNQRLATLANDRIGETTALIYAEALRLLEEKIPCCQIDKAIDNEEDLPEGPSFTTMELVAAVGSSIKVARGIGTTSGDKIDTRALDRPHKRKARKVEEAEVEGEASSDEEVPEDEPMINGNGSLSEMVQDSDAHEDDPFDDDIVTRPTKRPKVTFQDKLPKAEISESKELRAMQVKSHLLLLAADECKFIRKCGIRGSGEWVVDFHGIVQHLQNAELDSMLLENFGRAGHRLARIMRTLGKLDEKQLPNLALMKQKDVRTKLAEMQMAGVIDIQEIPRDSGHTTGRTMFLWYFDRPRVSAIFLDSVYKCMSRSFQRLDIERRRAHDILECTERSDVRDLDPAMYLDGPQLTQLMDIRAKEENILGQINRLDELVGIFRDY